MITDNKLVSFLTLEGLIRTAASISLFNAVREVMLPWLSVSIYHHPLTPAESSEDLKRAVLAHCSGR